MAFTTIAKSSDHFDCPTWTGSDSTTTITGMGFKPDSLWIRRYDGGGHPVLNDSSKGIGFNWIPSGNNANDTTNYVASYTSDGFTLTGNIANTNDASDKYVGACWKANGGTTSANSDGATASVVQVNTTAGFSIVTYTGGGAATTIGHGLGVAPKAIFVKNTAIADRGVSLNMSTVYVSDPETDNIQFAGTSGSSDGDDKFNDTAPTSTVFSVGSSNMVSGNTQAHVAYCFAEVQGFSKFGFYSGTGNVRGTKVYCGFRPKWIMIKTSSNGNGDFVSKVSGLTGYGTGGQRTRSILFNNNDSNTNATVQFESNGFRCASTDQDVNEENVIYWYMAFAEMPMVGTNGITALAT